MKHTDCWKEIKFIISLSVRQGHITDRTETEKNNIFFQ